MKRKRRLKRVSAFILAVALIIANCTPIFADEMSDAPEEVVPIIEPLTEEDLVVNDENNGDIVTPDVTPEVTKEVTPEITPVVPDVTEGVTPEITKEVTPGITEEVTTYTVTFVGLDDEVIATVSVKPDDEAVEYPTAPEKDGFIFTGWDKEINVKDLTENITVKALYDKVEANEVLVEREEQKVFGNKTVTVKGNIPEDAEVIISDVSSIERVENILSDEIASDENVTITVHEAYDIKIMLDGEVWQPCEHDSVVTISIDNINTDKELNIHRIDGNDVTAITPVIEENNIIFETEHFTIFTVDTVNYNTDDGYFEAFGKVYNISDAIKTNIAATKDNTKIYGYLFDDLYAVPTDGITVTDVELSPVWSDDGINKADLEGKKLFIGDDVFTSIGSHAFNDCSGFTGTLNIPSSVTKIGGYVFADCSGFTGDLVISDSVTSIDNGAFSGCTGFTGNLVISNSVTSIDLYTFNGCSGFTGDLVIPNSVTNIGQSAFFNCSGFNGTLTLSNSLTEIPNSAFWGCKGLTGDLVIPNSITSIGEQAFRNCSGFNGTLNIPNSVTSIGSLAFHSCSGFIGNLVIPDSVISIGGSAFNDCTGFTGTLNISSSVTSIGSHAFYGCEFTGDLVIPNSVTSIGEQAFGSCKGFNGTLTLSNSLTEIPNSAFIYCEFTGDLVIPNSVTSIGEQAFYGCEFTGDLVIPDSVTSIGSNAFNGYSNIETITVPSSVTYIGSRAFSSKYVKLDNVTITNDIGDNPHFSKTTYTNAMTMYANVGRGEGITKLEPNVLYNDTLYYTCVYNLTYTNDGADSGEEPNAHIGIDKGSRITLSTGTLVKENYILAGWSDGTNIYDTDATITVNTDITLSPVWEPNIFTVNGITYKKSEALKTNKAAKKDSKTIYGYLFDDLYAVPTDGITVTDATLSPTWSDSGITTSDLEGKKLFIGDNVFSNIGQNAFKNCTGFTGDLIIPNSVTKISNFAFNGCSNIETITVPSSVTYIGSRAFSSKYVKLDNVTITNDIGDNPHFSMTTYSGAITMYANNGRGEVITKLKADVTYNDTLYYKERCDVTYTSDGATSGSVPEAHIDVVKGSKITLSSGTLVKEGYMLSGWTDGTNTYLLNATITVNDNMTLSPVWEIDTFTVNGITYKRSEALKTNVVATKDGTTIYGYLFDDLYAIPTNGITVTDVELKPTWSDSGINKADLEGKKLYIGDNVFTSIGYSAFSDCSGLTGTLNIPNGVTSIGGSAFNKCSGFTGNLVIPNSVTSIGNYAFSGCSGFDGTLNIPSSVTSIGQSTFSSCSGLTGDLVIPDSVTSISQFAFNGCSNIETITVPSSVTYIGSRAFSSKYVKLDNVTITNNESFTFSNIAGSSWAYYYANSGRGNSIKKLESNVLYNDTFARERLIETFQTNDGTTYNINDAIKKNIVATYNDTEIYGYLFDDLYAIPTDISRLNDVRSAGVALTINPVWSDEGVNKSELSGKKLYIGYNIFKSVGDNAFKDCHLTGSLDLGSTNINSIGAHAFENNDFTGWLNLPWTITSLGEYAFADNANLGGSVSYNWTTVPDGLFKNCGISSIWLSSPTSIGAEAFKNTNISSIQIPSSVTSIGKDAFDGIMSVSFDNVTITNDIGDDTHFNTTMYANVGRGEGIRKLEPNVLYNDTYVDYQLFNVTYLTDGADSGEAPSGVIDWRSTVDYTIKDNNTLAKSGYTFKCWIDTDGVTYNAGKVLKLTKTLNLSPVWDRIIPTYTVTYIGTGSTSGNVPSLSDTVNEGSEYTVKGKGTLARDGYNFVCWSDGTNEYYLGDTISAVNNDITLSPVWDRVIPTYTVTYLGTNSTSGSVPTLSDTVNEGSEYTVKGKGTLARDGYTFKAWTDSVHTYYPGDTITVTADITLSPVWEEIPVVVTHTVTYTDNEATEGTAPSADTVTDGSRYTLKNKGTLKKSGYVFKGWKLGDTVYEAGDSIIVNTDITLTSVWEEVVINNSTNNTGSGTGNSNSTSTDSTNKSISADTDDNAPIIATTPVTKKVENNTMPILNNVPKKNVKVNKPVIVDTTEEAEESIEETEPVLDPVLEVTEGTIINNDVNDEINESSEVTVTNKPKEKKMPIIPISAGAATILLGIVVYAYKKNIG